MLRRNGARLLIVLKRMIEVVAPSELFYLPVCAECLIGAEEVRN